MSRVLIIGMTAVILVFSATSWADKNTESDEYFHEKEETSVQLELCPFYLINRVSSETQ